MLLATTVAKANLLVHRIQETMYIYGSRPLKSTRRHRPFLGLVTCDIDFYKIATWDMAIS